ncbi:polysaccharide pyruvyl transferase family protein [Vibrio crassostreae]|uniref:polysaccharide pyruvyl transferase family protein n=1 Tax=Vibrio crassostreae TaxID=246167 RepID=UPI000F4A38E1|nr:polysaccharide pyruvyl transferase family protein [Vibrio crassostreae]ROS65585.1 exopolysaccharide biosynthesis predicted pyruvyl transferase EpsI [Vibrio crassostreae]RPF12606.1 exopolysaccharide biosynthesis predicted pyruvyl transferase EpsI [Vibrio crassostreae]TCT39779.1 exopolysaccharide biosynthesis predicted pyruvyl transferase EpsI [Vibrio crassostreae]TCV60203.1 exopolysaccharide biosynthesis predicted pyruvyl transferase EpsI [Vibrio crassostreae]
MKKITNKVIRKIKSQIKWAKNSSEVKSRFNVSGKRIIYAITPTPELSNLGDQAQVVAIYDWLQRNYPEHSIIEVNKDEVINCVSSFKSHVKNDDLIVLHSGGNLGDRGLWSETSRRTMIFNFPNNKILSLPQTINFRDTDKGQKELATSKAIYNCHPNLTVVARDNESYRLANTYFNKCSTNKAPDFVLSYNTQHLELENKPTNGKVLFCLREDDESDISKEQREKMLENSELEYDVFDTTIPENINNDQRKQKLDDVLKMFSEYEYIVTDRFHGLIFSILCKKPTVVLKTVDHKLTSAFDWFDEVNFVKFADSTESVNKTIKEVLKQANFNVPDWNEKHFDQLTKHL